MTAMTASTLMTSDTTVPHLAGSGLSLPTLETARSRHIEPWAETGWRNPV
jgi:hypothetical protein